jgi:hypothetical protein
MRVRLERFCTHFADATRGERHGIPTGQRRCPKPRAGFLSQCGSYAVLGARLALRSSRQGPDSSRRHVACKSARG